LGIGPFNGLLVRRGLTLLLSYVAYAASALRPTVATKLRPGLISGRTRPVRAIHPVAHVFYVATDSLQSYHALQTAVRACACTGRTDDACWSVMRLQAVRRPGRHQKKIPFVSQRTVKKENLT